ncbi:hypothetical protein HMPREF3039_03198 [Akkermansia sp. KLE1798]|nr:hypothetical protein HMPREF3039_03198 [Akkermansia sp. KLE1798]
MFPQLQDQSPHHHKRECLPVSIQVGFRFHAVRFHLSKNSDVIMPFRGQGGF